MVTLSPERIENAKKIARFAQSALFSVDNFEPHLFSYRFPLAWQLKNKSRSSGLWSDDRRWWWERRLLFSSCFGENRTSAAAAAGWFVISIKQRRGTDDDFPTKAKAERKVGVIYHSTCRRALTDTGIELYLGLCGLVTKNNPMKSYLFFFLDWGVSRISDGNQY